MRPLLSKALAAVGESGIDVTFENVGGETFEAALELTRRFGRIVVCGAISEYQSAPAQRHGVKNLANVIGRHIRIEGFVVGDWGGEAVSEAREKLIALAGRGEIKPLVTLVHGWDKLPSAFASLFASGQHTGKLVVQL